MCYWGRWHTIVQACTLTSSFRYLQFFFNLSLVFGFLYLAYQFLRAVQTDVELKMTEYSLGESFSIAYRPLTWK